MNYKLFFPLIFTLMGCNFAEKSYPSKIELQRDIFIQENQCGERRVSTLRVLSLNIFLPEGVVSPGMKFHIEDRISRNKEEIQYMKDHLLYSNGHKEYNLIACEEGKCELELYLFTDEWKDIGSHFEIALTAISGGKTVLQTAFERVENAFSSMDRSPVPQIRLKKINDQYSLLMPKSEIDKVKATGASELEAVIVWRHEGDVLYREKAKVFETAKMESLTLTHEIKNPTYLAAMVMYKRDRFAYEIKHEIMNEQNAYFKCKK